MVETKWQKYLFLFIILSLGWKGFGYADDVNVSVTLDHESYESGKLITGTIEVTHDIQNKIDVAQFYLNGKSLPVEFVKDVYFSPDNPLVLSIYRFSLPPETAGQKTLSPITLQLNDKIYRSSSNSYEVKTIKTVKSSTSGNDSVLEVDAQIVGNPPFYPGQHFKLQYTYYYVGDIELIKEQLPLLEAKGLVKIGQKSIEDGEKDGVSIRRISQEVRSSQPGKYTFPASEIEGYGYQLDALGNKISKILLKSNIPEMTVEISPFPKEGKPASFNGSYGQFDFQVKMLTPEEIHVGDKLTLQLTFSGTTEDWSIVQMPELCCQPGFSGFFEFPDLPPQIEMGTNSKTFTLDLRPLSPFIQAVPRIQFSFFDPTQSKYFVKNSSLIPLKVDALVTQKSKENKDPSSSNLFRNQVSELDLPILRLKRSDLSNRFLASWWNLLGIPLGVAFLLWQKKTKENWERQKKEKKQPTSAEFYQTAFNYPYSSGSFIFYLQKAFKTRLWEKKLISSRDERLDQLTLKGPAAKLQNLLKELELQTYGYHQKQHMDSGALKQIQELFDSL